MAAVAHNSANPLVPNGSNGVGAAPVNDNDLGMFFVYLVGQNSVDEVHVHA